MSPVLKAGPVSQARYEALRILVRVEQDKAFADIVLEHALDLARLDARDDALCTEIVYGTLRWRRHLDWRLAPHLNRPLAKLDPWVRALLRLTAYQLLFLDRVPRWAAVDEAVSIARLKSTKPGPRRVRQRRPARPHARGRRRRRRPPCPSRRRRVRWSFPDWIAERWIARYGMREAEALMAAMNERPPMTIRANRLRITREDLGGAAPRRGARRDAADARSRPRDSSSSAARRRAGRPSPQGWCTIQDEASMLIARLLAPAAGRAGRRRLRGAGHQGDAPGRADGQSRQDPRDRSPGARLRLVGDAAARLGIGIIEAHDGRGVDARCRG